MRVRDLKALRAAPVAADAALLGAIPLQAAAAIGQAITNLPDEVGPEPRAEGEDILLGYAVGRDGTQLHARVSETTSSARSGPTLRAA